MPSSAALTNSCRKHSIPLCVAAVMLSSLSAGIAHSVAVAPKPPLHPAGQSGVLQILVMGDSYSAGNGAGGQIKPNNGCYRSDLNYAGQFAAIIEAATGRKPQKVDNFACSGAKTSDFTHKQGTRLNFALSSPQPPQLSGLKNKHYDVIFLTIGGNDLKFDATAEFCLVTLTKIANQCERSLKNAERLITNGTLKKNIKNVLDAIHKQANSDAKIVLVGYPQLEGDPTYELAVGKSILPRKKAPPIQVGKRLNAGGTTVDGIQSDVVDELNAAYPANPPQFSFVSVKALFAGHELFANVFNPNRWMIEPLIDANVVNTYYHPNPMGWLQEAQLLACDTRIPNQKLAGTTTHNPVALPFNCPTSPPPPPPRPNPTRLASGLGHSCAVLANSTIKCWGGNGEVQFGATAVAVVGIFGATQVSAEENHSCALLANTTIKCWGYNFEGQLGDGTTATSTTAVAVVGITGATQISSGQKHSCALLADTTIKCWGLGAQGELGNGSNISSSSTPVAVVGITGATAISSGAFHSCALLADTTIKCWGHNGYGQLGDAIHLGTFDSSTTPVTVVAVSGATSISSGAFHSCALLADTTIKCWGYNSFGQLGSGTTSISSTAVTVVGLTGATQISTGFGFSCASLDNTAIKCWGGNSSGELGNGSTGNPSTTPGSVLGL